MNIFDVFKGNQGKKESELNPQQIHFNNATEVYQISDPKALLAELEFVYLKIFLSVGQPGDEGRQRMLLEKASELGISTEDVQEIKQRANINATSIRSDYLS